MPTSPRVLVPLAAGFEETEAIAVVDVLRRARAMVTLASVGIRDVVSKNAVKVEADAFLADVIDREWEAIVLPGGPGTPKLNDAAGLHARLRRQAREGKLVAAICAAPTVLAKAGLLEGVEATCYPTVRDSMGGAIVRDASVVQSGNIITSQGMGTAVEFGLRVAAYLVGEETAIGVARSICYPPKSAFCHA